MADYPKVQHYLLVMHGDVEPELRGPFTDDERTDRARLWRKEHGDDDGLFRVDATGPVEIASFTGAEVDEWDSQPRRCTLCNCTATGERFGFAVCPYHHDATEDDPPCPTCMAVSVGDRVRDPHDRAWREIVRIEGGTAYMADGGCMSVAECATCDIRLPSEGLS